MVGGVHEPDTLGKSRNRKENHATGYVSGAPLLLGFFMVLLEFFTWFAITVNIQRNSIWIR